MILSVARNLSNKYGWIVESETQGTGADSTGVGDGGGSTAVETVVEVPSAPPAPVPKEKAVVVEKEPVKETGSWQKKTGNQSKQVPRWQTPKGGKKGVQNVNVTKHGQKWQNQKNSDSVTKKLPNVEIQGNQAIVFYAPQWLTSPHGILGVLTPQLSRWRLEICLEIIG